MRLHDPWVLGLLVLVDDGTVSLAEIGAGGGSKRDVELGIDEVYELDFELDAADQASAVEKAKSTNPMVTAY